MTRKPSHLAIALAFALATAASLSSQAAGMPTILTGPQSGPADRIALDYLRRERASLGLAAADLEQMQLRDDYVTGHNGVRHLYWRQRLDGIAVWNGELAVNVTRDGRIINVNNHFVPELGSRALLRTPVIDAQAAIVAAARALGRAPALPPLLLRSGSSVDRWAVFAGGELSRDEIPVALMYQPALDRRSVRLVWDLVIHPRAGADWWSMRVDAQTGAVVSQVNWRSDAQYRVFPFPAENPDQTAQTLVTDPHDAQASPFGWHDTNGAAGAEFTITRGNNVDARDDLDGDDSGGDRPDGGAGLIFDQPFTATLEPDGGSNLNAAIVNLFYWTNRLHDLSWRYGFDEAAGNFQVNNYGRGGLGNDGLSADALDGLLVGSSNNANFATPPDGQSPRMQMFRWLAAPALTVTSPVKIAGTFPAASGFGTAVFTSTALTGSLRLVDDGSGVSVSDGCEALAAGSLTGQIALIDRGNCEFGVKLLNVQQAGAVAGVVINNVGGAPTAMGPGAVGGQVNIPNLMISQAIGGLIRTQLPTPGVASSIRSVAPHRDSDFDAGIMAHEYGHGISNRLTGGPSNTSCLRTDLGGGVISEQAGEGWSDFWALAIHAKATDTPSTSRYIGSYASFGTEGAGPGIRNFPYNVNIGISPHTYADVATTNAPHGVGEIWAGALWNLYWNLVDAYGWSPDLYNGTAGNTIAIQLVVDGMKLQPCEPTMVQARDAILLADQTNNAGANQCLIWAAFANKGLGLNAEAGSFARGDESEDFSVPAVCEQVFLTDGFE